MPIFEYLCGKCGKVTELLRLAGDDSVPACGKCGSTQVDKIFSVPAKYNEKSATGCAAADNCGMGGSCAMQGGPSSPCCGGACNH